MIMRSRFPDVDVPPVPVHQYVLRAVAANSEKVALVDAETSECLTYGEFGSAVATVAGALSSRGLVKGDVLAIYSSNHLLYPVVFHAAVMAGLTVTTVSALATRVEAATQLRDCRARAVVAGMPQLDDAIAAAAEAGVEQLIPIERVPGRSCIRSLMREGTGAAPRVPLVVGGTVAALPYSSGTTGLPKGVMLTHRNLVANLCQMQALLSYDASDTLLVVLPLSHIYGLQVLMNLGLAHGATIVIGTRFTPQSYLSALELFRVTRAHVAPPMLVALAENPALVGRSDLTSLRSVFSAAAPLGAPLAEAVGRLLGCPVTQGYGMTELSPACHLVPFDEPSPVAGSVGVLVPSTQARLVDPVTGADVDDDEGEVWVRGPQVMKGYLNRPDATADLIDADGWLHTGDIARIDSEGNLFVVDRIKDLIKYKGYQVAPAELEAVLLTHPGVADVAVVGAHIRGEEVPKAFVVPHTDARMTAEEITDFLAPHVAPYKRLRAVEFVPEIPKSPSGKILRRQLRAGIGSCVSPADAPSATRS